MSVLSTVPEDEATGYVAELYADDIADQGYVGSHTKLMALNPEAYRAWEALAKAVAGPMDKRRYELVTLAAAQAIGSRQCRLAHGRRTLRYIGEEELVAIARNYHEAGLSPAEVAMMEFAEKVSTDSASITDDDALHLRSLGFTDADIVEISLAAAMRNYYSRAIHALGADFEELPGVSAELRDALIGGI